MLVVWDVARWIICVAWTNGVSATHAIARDDDATFGILHSRFHEAWAPRLASRHGVGEDATYSDLTRVVTVPYPRPNPGPSRRRR